MAVSVARGSTQSRPERTIHLYNGDSPDLGARLERGDLDAMVGSMRLTSPALRYATLHAEHYVFVGRKARVRNPDDASSVTLVDVSGDLPLFRYFLDALPAAAPWAFARVEYMGGIAAIRRRCSTETAGSRCCRATSSSPISRPAGSPA